MLWDVRRGSVVRKFAGHMQRIQSVAFNADSGVLCSASHDTTVRAFDVRSRDRHPIQILDQFSDAVSTVCCTRDCIVAASIDGTVKTFDLRAGKVLSDEIHDPVTSLAVTRDEACYVAATVRPPGPSLPRGAEGVVRLWERKSGAELAQYKGHRNREFPVAVSLTSVDDAVVIGGEDGKITVWDLVSGDVRNQFEAHRDVCSSVAIHPDTRAAGTGPVWVSTGFDGVVKVWGSESVRSRWRAQATEVGEREAWSGHVYR